MHIAVFLADAGYDTDGNEGPVDGVYACKDWAAAERLAANRPDMHAFPINADLYARIRAAAASDQSEILYLDECAPGHVCRDIWTTIPPDALRRVRAHGRYRSRPH